MGGHYLAVSCYFQLLVVKDASQVGEMMLGPLVPVLDLENV